MYSEELILEKGMDLRARAAAFFVQKADEFKSVIWIENEKRRVNAKSLLGILSLGISEKDKIKIIADGTDEKSAVQDLVKFISSGFTLASDYERTFDT
ncbi:MAG: HPr family phosphocarrier protein [Oscillospiraceae bacterium]|jgi:phosphocarrier protein|nr:HPr family phosphocarrier protein [Oscillospiraceae bacterium]